MRVIFFLAFIFTLMACQKLEQDYSKLPKSEFELEEQFRVFSEERGVANQSTSAGEQLFYIQGSDVTMLSMMAASQKAQLESMKSIEINIDLNVLRRAQELYIEEAKADMTWIASEFGKIYEAAFTEEELLFIRGFLLSDVGQKWINSQPDLMSRGVSVGEQLSVRLEPKVQKRLEAEIADLDDE